MDTLIIAAIVAVTGFILFWQWRVIKQAKRSEGSVAPDTSAVDNGIAANRRIYYFYALHCGPCKSMAPMVDQMREEFPNLIKVDVAKNIDLARGFGIAATPSFILVQDKVIKEVKLGGVSASWLRERLSA